MKVGRYNINVTNEHKILFPESGFTKCDLIEYYRDVSEFMIPLIKNRPLTMVRYPDGINGKRFFQKKISDYFPDWIKTISVGRKNKSDIEMVICNNAATLVYLANQACITPHVWLSRCDKIDYPDRLIFDLDPPEGKFDLVVKGAKAIRELMENKLNMRTFLMTTGSKGLHVVIPIKRERDFNFIKNFARKAAEFISSRNSEEFTTEHRIEKRKSRLFIDYLRNEYAQTGVAPYAVRAKEGAPVAVPIHWKEIDTKNFSSGKFNIKNIFKRLEKIEDPWKDISRQSYSVVKAGPNLEKLING